jgi:translation initiation factor 5B
VQRVTAATGVKIAAPGIEGAVAGMPVIATSDPSSVAGEFSLPTAMVEGESEGVIIKADTVGSIEALGQLLQEQKIPIHRASVGPVSKKDVTEASAQPNPVIIAFNVPVSPGVDTDGVAVIASNIIYHIIDRYAEHTKRVADAAAVPIRPTKVELLRNHIFRQSNPLICGMHIGAGELSTGMQLMKDGVAIAVVRDIQENKESVGKAGPGKSVAVSLQGPTAGRQCGEGDVLYSFITEEQFRALRAASKLLTEAEKQTLREIATIMRAQQPLWGV